MLPRNLVGEIMNDETWRRNLAARRRHLGMSLEDLAARLGIHPAAIAGLEDGSLRPDGDLRESWEEALSVAAARPRIHRVFRRDRPPSKYETP